MEKLGSGCPIFIRNLLEFIRIYIYQNKLNFIEQLKQYKFANDKNLNEKLSSLKYTNID